MRQRVGRLCWVVFGLFATSLFASPAPAQSATDAEVRFLDPRGAPLPADLVIVRDSQGLVVRPTLLPNGAFAFVDVGPKVVIEFATKSLKNPRIELTLEPAPLVYVTLVFDPDTGRIKSVSQKPCRPKGNPREKVRKTPGGQQAIHAPPANDDCANALPIFDGATAFSTVDATTDGPSHAGDCQFDGQTYEDIWYEYIATCNGTLTVSTCSAADYDTDIVVYDGNDCSMLVRLGCNDDAFGCVGFTSMVNVPVVAGNPYLIRIGGFTAGDEGTGTVTCTCSGPPAEDECATAGMVACGSSTSFSNAGATTNGTDPAFSCASGGAAQGDGTMWFEFMATDTTAQVDTNLSDVADTLLALYDGSCGALVELGCSDDEGEGFLSQLCVNELTPGNTYIVQVASFPDSGLGDITLSVTCPGPCEPTPGDDCADAQPLACGGSATFNNSGASTDPADPVYSCRVGGPDQGAGTVWYTFVATETSAQVDTEGSAVFDTLLAVYDGTCGAFVELGCSDDDGEGFLSKVCVEGLTIGNTYYVQVASFDSPSLGEITLNLTCPCPPGPPNDECSGAFDLGPLPASVVFDTTGATDDIGTPCGVVSGPFNNLWYRVAGTGNTITATTCAAGTMHPDTKISVFCADCDAHVCVGGNDDQQPFGSCGFNDFDSTVSWCSQVGATYFITVGGFAPDDVGVVQLDVFDDGLACMPLVQCLPTGGCCLADGTCVTTTADDCAALGGNYQGDGNPCIANAVADGSFEAGTFAGIWTEASTNFGTPICDASCMFGGGTGPRTGSFWAWFGGIAAFEEGLLAQSVTIPTNASTLDFFLEIPAASGNGVDFLEVKLDGIQVYLALESDGPYVGYLPVSIPVGAFADGGVHALEFHSIITGEAGARGAALSNFFVDDVSIESASIDCPECFELSFDDGSFYDGQGSAAHGCGTWYEPGVVISGTGNNSGPALFDSTPGGPNDPSQDTDLLVGQGLILILQGNGTSQVVQGGPCNYIHPNDDEDGGALFFDFDTSDVDVLSIDLIDIDLPAPTQNASVVLTDHNGKTRTYSVPAGWTGNGGVGTLDLQTLAPQPGVSSTATATQQPGFDATNVGQVKVTLGSSGAVDNLSFCK